MSDVQTLSDTLDAIAEDVTSVVTEITNLEAEVADLQSQIAAGQPVDLSGVLAKATAIRESLESIGSTASQPTETPTPTPAPSDTPPATDTPTEPVETAPTSSNEFDDNGNPTTTVAPPAEPVAGDDTPPSA